MRVLLGWVRSHIGIKGHKEVDDLAKKATLPTLLKKDIPDPITEGGIKQRGDIALVEFRMTLLNSKRMLKFYKL